MDWKEPCGCSLMDGRCAVHAAMMRRIHEVAWESHSAAVWNRVGAHADGFGSPGENIGDWSAFRDSSVGAVERMWKEAIK